MDKIYQKYYSECIKNSDIYEHLPTLYKYASECESVIELGVRGCCSSWAFVYGILNNNKQRKYLFLNDIEKCDINELLYDTQFLDIKINYIWENDLTLNIPCNFDITFIDTYHVYGQLKRELNKYAPFTNKYIIMHDTTIDGELGELYRSEYGVITNNNINVINCSKKTGIPIDELICGLTKAVEEFLQQNKNWVLHEKFENNNGLTILRRTC